MSKNKKVIQHNLSAYADAQFSILWEKEQKLREKHKNNTMTDKEFDQFMEDTLEFRNNVLGLNRQELDPDP